MDRKLHIGIIGCGGIANGKHMPSLKKIDDGGDGRFLRHCRGNGRKRPPRNTAPRTPGCIPTTKSC